MKIYFLWLLAAARAQYDPTLAPAPPTYGPTLAPTWTKKPTTAPPTKTPTAPTHYPTSLPTPAPTITPKPSISFEPTPRPSHVPTPRPTHTPSAMPTTAIVATSNLPNFAAWLRAWAYHGRDSLTIQSCLMIQSTFKLPYGTLDFASSIRYNSTHTLQGKPHNDYTSKNHHGSGH